MSLPKLESNGERRTEDWKVEEDKRTTSKSSKDESCYSI